MNSAKRESEDFSKRGFDYYTSFEGYTYRSTKTLTDAQKNRLEGLRSDRLSERLKSASVDAWDIEIIGDDAGVWGMCWYDEQIIQINEKVLDDYDFLREVYLHELAHKICKKGQAHNEIFFCVFAVLLCRYYKQKYNLYDVLNAQQVYHLHNAFVADYDEDIFIEMCDCCEKIWQLGDISNIDFTELFDFVIELAESKNSIEEIAEYLLDNIAQIPVLAIQN